MIWLTEYVDVNGRLMCDELEADSYNEAEMLAAVRNQKLIGRKIKEIPLSEDEEGNITRMVKRKKFLN